MKSLALILIAGLAAYAQHGHGGGGSANAGGVSRGISSPVGTVHGNDGNNRGTTQLGRASQQSPGTILERNTKLSSKLDGLLPAGTTAQQACSGFKNLGECVSAIHVSHNLDVPFEELKGRITGKTPEKLGQAIHQLKPEVDSKAEAKRAQKQAKSDLKETSGPVS